MSTATLPIALLVCPLCHEHHLDRSLYACKGCKHTFCARTVGALVNGYFHFAAGRCCRALCGPLSREHVTVDLEVAQENG